MEVTVSSRTIVTVFLSVAAISLLIPSCAQTDKYGAEVSVALNAAGDNRPELESVLEHYDSLGDSLKLEAACFLIGNMEGHSYVIFKFEDTSGENVDFDVLDYPDYDSLIVALTAIEDERGELDYNTDEKYDDLETIKADFLIDQIDYAFRAWREKPWAKDLTFEQFREYVLPYRGSGEPLESWRGTFWDKYAQIDSGMTDPTDPIEAAIAINSDIKTWFTFDPRFYLHPTDQGMTEMISTGMGRCEDMTNLTIYAFRANGLAITSDYTPYWANTGNNHAWNSILNTDGNVIPFMGAEADPGSYNLNHKAAKVYRKTYSHQKQNLVFQDHKQEKIPRWLSGKNYRDVTTNYSDVCDVEVEFEDTIPDSVDIAYLCVFNSGEWKAIHWARIENESATFTDMGAGIAYLAALYMNEEIAPFGIPFILNDDCSQRVLKPDLDRTITAELTSTTKRKLQASTDGIAISHFTTGTIYGLSYFDDGWQSVGESVADDGPLVFDSLPGYGLYWLTAEDSDHEERIFTIEEGQQVWW